MHASVVSVCSITSVTMRIAQISPLIESVPPKLYGGTERIVSYLTEELVRQGHEVVLFASGDSETAAELAPCSPKGLRLAQVHDAIPYNVLQLEYVGNVPRSLTSYISTPTTCTFPCCFRSMALPTMTTMHGRLRSSGNAIDFLRVR